MGLTQMVDELLTFGHGRAATAEELTPHPMVTTSLTSLIDPNVPLLIHLGEHGERSSAPIDPRGTHASLSCGSAP
ncbi:MAG: hypothetical protein IPG92_11255 [Flavobacteriales bacterium]|nr:hypothetical protein [Flavobacteriales bacterium]